MIFHAYVVSRNGQPRYVGVTTRGVDKRWRYGHLQPGGKTRSALKDAIKRHGRDAFTIEHVASARNMEELSDLEKILIEQHRTMTPNGYNLKTGGFIGVVYSDEVRIKMGAGKRGKKHTPEQRARNSAAQKGKKMSDAAKAKLSARMKGVPMPGAVKEKLRAKHIGKTLSEEHKRKLSVAHIGKNTGPRGPMSEETRDKIGIANKGRKRSPEAIAKMKVIQTGHSVSQETRQKLRTAHKGRKPSPITMKKALEANLGRRASAQTRERMRAAQLRRWHGDQNQVELLSGMTGQ